MFWSSKTGVGAVCCGRPTTIRHTCDSNGNGVCESRICKDAILVSSSDIYCGYGSCNIFGCNCDFGCRTNRFDTWDEAKILFAFVMNVSILD